MKYSSSKPETIQGMFGRIASNYDRTNIIASFGLNLLWNHRLIQRLSGCKKLVDICAGTGIVAFSFLQKEERAEALLVDFCPQMLAQAPKMAMQRKICPTRYSTLVASAESIPLETASFDAATIAYGIRNILDLKSAFKETARLLKPEGKLLILELTRPSNPLIRLPHHLYLKRLLPWVGNISSSERAAYEYLSQSILKFLSPLEVKKLLHEVGFSTVTLTPLFFGTATLIEAQKGEPLV